MKSFQWDPPILDTVGLPGDVIRMNFGYHVELFVLSKSVVKFLQFFFLCCDLTHLQHVMSVEFHPLDDLISRSVLAGLYNWVPLICL